jgi:hypothetical protein
MARIAVVMRRKSNRILISKFTVALAPLRRQLSNFSADVFAW